MNKYKELKKIIIENDPSILDLVFGCEVEYRGFDVRVISQYYDDIELENVIKCVKKKDITKIIGRPITLFDIRKILKDDDFLKLSKIWTGKLEELKDVDIKWLLSVAQ